MILDLRRALRDPARMRWLTVFAGIIVMGCGASSASVSEPAEPAEAGLEPTSEQAEVLPAERSDGRVSTTPGPEGGAVVMWPRIVPFDQSDRLHSKAAALQARLYELTEQALPEAEIDVRPAPQRVCPKQGCACVVVGAALMAAGESGCTAVAWVSEPGVSPAQLFPWAGEVSFKQTPVPFRAPVESQVVMENVIPCSELFTYITEEREQQIVQAIAGAQ